MILKTKWISLAEMKALYEQKRDPKDPESKNTEPSETPILDPNKCPLVWSNSLRVSISELDS